MRLPQEDKIYQIALLEIAAIGPRIARKLIGYFGSAQKVWFAPDSALKELGRIGEIIKVQRSNEEHLNFAKAQVHYCENIGAEVISYYDKNYPYRLKQCIDAPLLIYQRGHCNLNAKRMVAIVGTRNCSSYGREVCNQLIEELQRYDVTIVSGLAFGIDACAHRAAVNMEMTNVAVVAHGLDRIYPSEHRGLAKRIIHNGAVITKFPTLTNPDRENFPKRNRIVAGLVDAVIVIESSLKGGSMITARLGNDYSRDVFAIPGKVNSECSKGCNHLIKTNQAHLLTSADDLAYLLGWDEETSSSVTQQEIRFDLNDTEIRIVDTLGTAAMDLDQVVLESELLTDEVSTSLLLLELKGVIKQLPGKKYQMA
jgi:DNA processing protein